MASGDLDIMMADAPPRLMRRRSAWSRCDEAVARVAPTATTTCQVCSAAIEQGVWQIGLMFIHVEGFMLMEWYHVGCTISVSGLVMDELLETVQSEMTSDQKQAFQDAVVKNLPQAS